MLSRLGTSSTYGTWAVWWKQGERLRVLFGADGCYGVIVQTWETRAEEFLSFPLYPKIVAEPWEEAKRAISSTMGPLIATYFRPAGRTQCCKTRNRQQFHCQLTKKAALRDPVCMDICINTYCIFEGSTLRANQGCPFAAGSRVCLVLFPSTICSTWKKTVWNFARTPLFNPKWDTFQQKLISWPPLGASPLIPHNENSLSHFKLMKHHKS